MLGIITVAIFLPVVMAVPTYLLGRKNRKVARILGLGAAAATFVVSMVILALYPM